MDKLENINVGDKLILTHGMSRTRSVVTVSGVTQTLIKIDSVRYRKSDGGMVGGDCIWGRSYLRIPEEGEIERLQKLHRKCVILKKLHELTVDQVTYEQALELEKILYTIKNSQPKHNPIEI